MRIVAKASGFLSLLVGVGVLLGGGPSVAAQEAALPAVASPSMAQAEASNSAVQTTVGADVQGIAVKGGEMIAEGPADAMGVPPSVKNVMKKFNTEKMKMTLGDLNEGREALAKLDMLIELEKRLADLEKIKADREKDRQSAMEGFSPVSTVDLSPMTRAMAQPVMGAEVAVSVPSPEVVRKQRIASSASDIVVEKVFGVNGQYKALVKVLNTPSTVGVGDELPSGEVVRSVSSQGIVIVSEGKEKKIDIKNVGMVAGVL